MRLNPLALTLYNNDTHGVGLTTQCISVMKYSFMLMYPFTSGEKLAKSRFLTRTWALTRTGKRVHLPPLCCKVFYVLVVTAKGSVDELFMHYFHNLSSASGGFAYRLPLGLNPWTPLGTLVVRSLIFQPMEKFLRAPRDEKNNFGNDHI